LERPGSGHLAKKMSARSEHRCMPDPFHPFAYRTMPTSTPNTRRKVSNPPTNPELLDRLTEPLPLQRPDVEHGDRVQARPLEQGEPPFEAQEVPAPLVVDVELEEVVGESSVLDGVPSIQPFAEQDVSGFEQIFEGGTLDDGPLLEQVVLRVHPLGDQVPPALERDRPAVGEVDADVGSVELLLDNQRAVGDELERLCSEYPYHQFPLVMDGQLVGLIDRSEILGNRSPRVAAVPAQAIPAHSTIREAVAKMVENSLSLLVVVSASENTPIGIVTLHDVLRLQNQLSDMASL